MSADEWLALAKEDMGVAEDLLGGRSTRAVCFHAQQAAEKALKACLAALGEEDIPKTHDLVELSLLIRMRIGGEPPRHGLRVLTQYAVATRYPGEDPPTAREAAAALDYAREVMEFVLETLGCGGDSEVGGQ